MLLFFLISIMAHAEEDKSPLTYCRFGPKMMVLEPVKTSSSDSCPGTAKVQGLMWKCGTVMESLNLPLDYKKKLIEAGRAECKAHCEARDTGCTGVFKPPTRCGIEMNADQALNTGQKLGCGSQCDGKYFVHCSIYNSGFVSNDPEMIKQGLPNCRCVRTEKKQNFVEKLFNVFE